jgi:hypothetical protein
MAETLQTGVVRAPQLVRAAQVAREAEVRQSANGVRFATYGETGVEAPDLDRMLEAVPAAIVAALKANTYYFVPLALRENADTFDGAKASKTAPGNTPDYAMVAGSYTDEFGDAAICHRNVELGSGKRGVFISTRLMGDRFALSFEFFINVAHAFVDEAGVPEVFAELAWQQALSNVRGETSLDAWEARNLAQGRPANAEPEATAAAPRRSRGLSFATASRGFGAVAAIAASSTTASTAAVDEKERGIFLESAFSDAVAIYLLSLALDFDYSELREREYPLLAPAALAARLKLVAELFPPNAEYEFAVKYRRKA